MEWLDAEAVAETRAGNTDAFRVLVERHSRAVFRLAYRMTGNEQDAEDVVQETFLRAFKQLKNFDGRASFGTWIYRVCTNCAIDFYVSAKDMSKSESRRVRIQKPISSPRSRSPDPRRNVSAKAGKFLDGWDLRWTRSA